MPGTLALVGSGQGKLKAEGRKMKAPVDASSSLFFSAFRQPYYDALAAKLVRRFWPRCLAAPQESTDARTTI